MNFGDERLPARFWDKVMPIPFPTWSVSGCWIWTGATTSKGYGSYYIGARGKRQVTGVAHKMTWEALHGRIKHARWKKKRLVIDHRCRERACCNPAHGDLVIEPVNVARGESPSALHARKTHCAHGHEYTPENTYVLRIKRDGRDTTKRYCRTCRSPKSHAT